MTKEVETLLERIQNNDIFEKYPLYFIGGTVLVSYLDHRVSYNIDIASVGRLPVSSIKAFAFAINATQTNDHTQASAFRINRGENLENFQLKYMVDGVKLELSFFEDEIRQGLLGSSAVKSYREGCKLKILPLEDIITLKAIALFGR